MALPIFKSHFVKAVAGEFSELLSVSRPAKPVVLPIWARSDGKCRKTVTIARSIIAPSSDTSSPGF